MQIRFLLASLLTCMLLITPGAAPAAPEGRTYLPLLFRDYPIDTIFGVEMSQVSPMTGLDLVLTSGTRWVRRNGLLWSEVEPVEDAGYRWDSPAVQQLEAEMLVASSNRLKLILVVRGSPKWAVAPYTADCAPINPSKYTAFGRFLAAAVERYSKPPYNVRYWEIGNEPDATLISTSFVFGCWGIEGDDYYGGRAYGAMLRAVYPRIKQANPDVQVINGGLLLDHPYTSALPTDTAGRFFEGMLTVGAGNAFDIVSFHTYNYYAANSQPFGSATDWRIGYLNDLLRRYAIPPKPLMRTETALLCVQVSPECRWSQADYVARTFVYSMRDGLLANIWYVYDNDSYHNTSLIEPGDVFVPRAAYFAYRNAAKLLSGAQYFGPVSGLPAGVTAYQLQQGGRTVIVYWTDSAQGLPWTLTVPQGSQFACIDRDGGNQPCAVSDGKASLTATRGPAFVVWSESR